MKEIRKALLKMKDFFSISPYAYPVEHYVSVKPVSKNLRVVIDPAVLIKGYAMMALVNHRTGGKEMMGFIIGTSENNVIIAEDVIFTGCQSEYASTEMNAAQMLTASKEAKERGFKTLGWIHSHPSFPTTPSSTDTTTCYSWEDFIKNPLMIIINGTDFYVGTTRKGHERELPFTIRAKTDTHITDYETKMMLLTKNKERVVSVDFSPTTDEQISEPALHDDVSFDIFNPLGIFSFITWLGGMELSAGGFLFRKTSTLFNKVFKNKRSITWQNLK